MSLVLGPSGFAVIEAVGTVVLARPSSGAPACASFLWLSSHAVLACTPWPPSWCAGPGGPAATGCPWGPWPPSPAVPTSGHDSGNPFPGCWAFWALSLWADLLAPRLWGLLFT